LTKKRKEKLHRVLFQFFLALCEFHHNLFTLTTLVYISRVWVWSWKKKVSCFSSHTYSQFLLSPHCILWSNKKSYDYISSLKLFSFCVNDDLERSYIVCVDCGGLLSINQGINYEIFDLK